MDVGVRELKQRLSEFLERVARGEVIRVTDRGRPKALLIPIQDERAIARDIAAHSGESGQSFRSNPDSNRSEATLW
jgi:prevent-host-death family protein